MKKSLTVTFAAAAIFAALFVGCGESTTDTAYIPQAKVPADLATSDLIDLLFKANDTVIIVASTNGEERVTIGTTPLIIPPGKTLDLSGHPLTVDTVALVVAGELTGLTAEGEQIADSGIIIAKSAGDKTKFTSYAAGSSTVSIELMSLPKADGTGYDVGGTNGKAYYFGTLSGNGAPLATGQTLENVTTVFGNVTIESNSASAVAPAALVAVYGNLTLKGTKETDPTEVTLLTNSWVQKDLVVDVKIAATATSKLTVGGKASVAAGSELTVTAGGLFVGGTVAVASDAAITVTAGGLTAGGDITVAAKATDGTAVGTITVTAGGLTAGGNVTLSAGASTDDGGAFVLTAGNSSIAGKLDVQGGASFSVATTSATVGLTLGKKASIAGTFTSAGDNALTVTGDVDVVYASPTVIGAFTMTGPVVMDGNLNLNGFCTVAATLTVNKVLAVLEHGAVGTADSSVITVAAGGSIDLSGGGLITLAKSSGTAVASLVLTADGTNPAYIKFVAEPTAAKTATHSTNGDKVATGSDGAFTFESGTTFANSYAVTSGVEKLVSGASKKITLTSTGNTADGLLSNASTFSVTG